MDENFDKKMSDDGYSNVNFKGDEIEIENLDVQEDDDEKTEKEKIRDEYDEELTEFRHNLEREYNQKRRELENKYDEELYLLEIKMKKNFRAREDDLIEKERGLKIREEEIDSEIKKLENKKVEKEIEIKKKEEEIEKLNKEITKKIGFEEYLNKNDFIYRNKLEAVLILRKYRNKNIKLINKKEYEIIFKNVVGSVNEMIKMNNSIIDYKLYRKKQERGEN